MEPTKEEIERIDAFMKEYGELIDKYKVDIFSFPVWIPDGKGNFVTVMNKQPVVTDRPRPTPSPEEFVPKS